MQITSVALFVLGVCAATLALPMQPSQDSAPAAAQPSADQPSAAQPSAPQPSVDQPSPSQPSGGQPTGGQPSPSQPSGGQPSPSQPSGGQPTGGQPSDGKTGKATGCVADGKAYNAGDIIELGKFWFNCTRAGREKFLVRAMGCINNGKRVNDGERYYDNEVVYRCEIDNDKNAVRAIGCVQTDGGSTVERRIGCYWNEGTPPEQYEMTCKGDEAPKKVAVRCNYNVGGGVYNIDPGCYRVVDKGSVGCVKDGDKLKFQTFPGNDTEKAASAAGLHAC